MAEQTDLSGHDCTPPGFPCAACDGLDPALLSVVERAIEHAANVDGATARPLLNEEARNLAGAVVPVIEQVCATLAEDLRKTKRERDRLLPFVIQKCSECGLVTAPQIEEG